MAETRVTVTDGTELAVTVTGRGPTIVLIPGLGATRSVFSSLVPLLATDREVVVYDQRGIGASQVTAGPYSTEQLADDTAALLDALGIGRCAVMGASFGGMVATQVAIRHPQRLTALVLAATGPGLRHLREEPTAEATAALLGTGARTPADAYRRACTVLYSARFQREHPDDIEAQVANRAAHPIVARAFQAQYAASRAHDPWDDLPSIHVPTLVLHGSDDRVMPAANARALAERIPGARYVEFPSLGHLFFHEDPEASAREILAFTGGRD